jgi:hypothetical protein
MKRRNNNMVNILNKYFKIAIGISFTILAIIAYDGYKRENFLTLDISNAAINITNLNNYHTSKIAGLCVIMMLCAWLAVKYWCDVIPNEWIHMAINKIKSAIYRKKAKIQ